MELTAHRTVALREALANDTDIAFVVALHALTLRLFYRYIRQPSVRMTLALGFGIPAAIAGYHVMLGVASLGVPSEAWRTVFASIGGLAAGVSAVLQLFALGEAPMPDAGEKGCVPPVSGR